MHLNVLNNCCKSCIKGLINPRGQKEDSKTKSHKQSLDMLYELFKFLSSSGVRGETHQ